MTNDLRVVCGSAHAPVAHANGRVLRKNRTLKDVSLIYEGNVERIGLAMEKD